MPEGDCKPIWGHPPTGEVAADGSHPKGASVNDGIEESIQIQLVSQFHSQQGPVTRVMCADTTTL